jgi:hypothetical protein
VGFARQNVDGMHVPAAVSILGSATDAAARTIFKRIIAHLRASNLL